MECNINTEIDKLAKNFLDKKNLKNPNSFQELGYIYFGPLVFNFFIWLQNDLNKNKKIIFNSREGYFLKEIYILFKKKFDLVEYEYFKTSRKLAINCGLFTKKDVYETFNYHRYYGNLSYLLKNRFSINKIVEKDFIIDTQKEIPNIDLYINEILEKSYELRNEYSKYVNNICDTNKKIIMIDTGYLGSTQSYLEKSFNLKFEGRYFTYKKNDAIENAKGFCDFEKSKFKNNISFFESVFIDKVGSYTNIINGNFINEPQNPSLLFYSEKEKIIYGIKKFVNDMLNKIDMKKIDVSYEFSDCIFNLMCKNNYVKNKKLFDIFYHDNFFVREDVKMLVRY